MDDFAKVSIASQNLLDLSSLTHPLTSQMNEIYTQYWGDVKPCRTCVAVKTLPLNTDVEIECIAMQ